MEPRYHLGIWYRSSAQEASPLVLVCINNAFSHVHRYVCHTAKPASLFILGPTGLQPILREGFLLIDRIRSVVNGTGDRDTAMRRKNQNRECGLLKY